MANKTRHQKKGPAVKARKRKRLTARQYEALKAAIRALGLPPDEYQRRINALRY